MTETLEEEARRWVQRKRRFYTIVVTYLALCALWLVIDVVTADDWWFYWPVFGAGIIVAIIGIAMFGVSGLFGSEWEGRQVARYLERQGPTDDRDSERRP